MTTHFFTSQGKDALGRTPLHPRCSGIQGYEPFNTSVTEYFCASQGKDALGRTPLHLAASILNPAFLPAFSQLNFVSCLSTKTR